MSNGGLCMHAAGWATTSPSCSGYACGRLLMLPTLGLSATCLLHALQNMHAPFVNQPAVFIPLPCQVMVVPYCASHTLQPDTNPALALAEVQGRLPGIRWV